MTKQPIETVSELNDIQEGALQCISAARNPHESMLIHYIYRLAGALRPLLEAKEAAEATEAKKRGYLRGLK